VLSDDGVNWRQARSVPTRSTLTSVTAVGDQVWAVGHDAVIIHSVDGGEHWVLQQAEPDLFQPLLDVFFVDDKTGFAIGAYAYFLATSDAGASWQPVSLVASDTEVDADIAAGAESDQTDYDYSDYQDDFVDYHLNAMAVMPDGRLYIAAEAGAGFFSDDHGQTWQGVALPYAGSMFGLLVTPDNSLIAFGLRGHVLESDDGGLNWQQRETGSLDSLLGGTVTANGTLVLVGASGELLTRAPGQTDFHSRPFSDAGDLAAVVAIDDRHLVVVGENGVLSHTLEGSTDEP